MGNRERRAWSSLAALTSLPMLGAVLGAIADERRHQGFTTWRSACRGSGLRMSSLIEFTFELLPLAIVGMLFGGLAVIAGGWLLRQRADICIAAHAGCVLSLPAALVLCALLPPLWMLVADSVFATGVSAWVLMQLRTPSRIHAAHP